MAESIPESKTELNDKTTNSDNSNIPETVPHKSSNWRSFFKGIVGVIIIVSFFKICSGNSYSSKEENGIVTSECEIDFTTRGYAVQELAGIIWKIANDHSEAKKIDIYITLVGKDTYGKNAKVRLTTPVELSRENIIEANKYTEYKYSSGSGLGQIYAENILMQNGYYPDGL